MSPSFKFELTPRGGMASGKTSFRTNIADIVGAVVSYRYVSARFAFVLNSGIQLNNEYAKSQYRTATIKYNNRGLIFQYKYIRIKGLTDVNASTGGTETHILRPDIVMKEFQFESVYNPGWRK